ncbi:MAG: 3-dehydroquinate synthase [Candidatus Eremiobacterota bacterium]
MPLKSFNITSKIKNYKVYFLSSREIKEKLLSIENPFYVIDSNVWKFYSKKDFSFIKKHDSVLLLKISENMKSFSSVFSIYEKLFEMASKKNTNIIAIGGGILQDVTGFAASTIYRGINWYFVPTTSLAQIDSCIGGKTSLNYKNYKNLIGTFYPPSEILINPYFLKTLKEEYYYSGIGEMVKLFIIDGYKKAKEIASEMEYIIDGNKQNLLISRIYDSLIIKKKYIEGDELDKGIRNILNYGHCFGHALEGAVDFKIPHGLAVVIGMMVANRISLKRNLIREKDFAFMNKEIFIHLTKKIRISGIRIRNDDIINFMRKDKKRVGKALTMVLMKNGYKFQLFNDITDQEVLLSSDYFLKLNLKEYFI